VLSTFDGWLKAAAAEVQAYVRLSWATARAVFSRPFYYHDVIEQLDAIGVGSLTVVLLTGIFTGAVLALQSGLTLDQFGARPVVGPTGECLNGEGARAGAHRADAGGPRRIGIAAELGSMVVTDQINALRALGTDPVRKLVVPRVLAGVVMAPILTIIADFMGILGGGIIAIQQLQVPASVYWKSITDGLYMERRLDGARQAVLSGFCDCQHRLPRGPRHKRRHTRRRPGDHERVVAASVAVLVLDFFITRLMITLLY
jgi:phospholipid/cholesterol/gamma-HCH transport system permease protein